MPFSGVFNRVHICSTESEVSFFPLNQLYIDLNNDEKIENDADMGEQEMFKTLEQMLSVLPSSIMRREMLEKIEHTDPFCGYPDVIRALKAKEDGNVKP